MNQPAGGHPAPVAGSGAGRWADLRPRLISAAILVAVGAVHIWIGGKVFLALLALIIGLMVWELARMTGRGGPAWLPVALGLAAGAVLAIDEGVASSPAWLLFPPVALAVAVTPRIFPAVSGLFALGFLAAGHGIFVLRDEAGATAFLWVLIVVIVSDVAGYFAGRLIGGPKFWPAVSPKKTWSGTVAGWLGAVLVGLGFWAAGQGGWMLPILSPFVAFAGQMGDIAESWIKRRAGVKDSSNLIPGHGGVMDRFDAVTGAILFVAALQPLIPLARLAGAP